MSENAYKSNSVNNDENNYYQILDITKNADLPIIKKAYKRMALKYHPDRNINNKDVSERQFKLVAEAYEVLSNPEKRNIYDKWGKDGLNNEGLNFNNISPFDIFTSLFEGDEIFSHGPPEILFMSNNLTNPLSKMATTHLDSTISKLETNLFSTLGSMGTMGTMGTMGRMDSMESIEMGAMGAIDAMKSISNLMGKNNPIKAAAGLNGLGVNISGGIDIDLGSPQINRGSNHRLETIITCNLSDIYFGSEKKISIEPLIYIEGRLERVHRNIKIKIPKGIRNGEKIIIANSGNQNMKGVYEDLFVICQIEPHKLFTRDGNDLQIEKAILLSEALTGYEYLLKHLNGNKYLLEYKGIIDNNSIHVVRNYGLPYRDSPNKYGDLYISYKIIFPKELSEDRCQLLKKILPIRKPLTNKNKSLTTLDVSCVDIESDDEALLANIDNQEKNNTENNFNRITEEYPFSPLSNLNPDKRNNQQPSCIQQ